MWTFDGLPLHPLLVHAPVVLVPLVATGLVLYVVWPSSRRVLGPILAALAIGAAVTAILAAEAGDHLADQLRRGEAVEGHQEAGELARLAAIVLAVGTVALAGLDRFRPDWGLTRSRVPAIVMALVGVGATIAVALAGHSGATLAWEEELAAALGTGTDEQAAPAPSPTTSPAATSTPPPASVPPTSAPPTTPAASTSPVAADPAGGPGIDVVLGEWTIVMDVEEAPPGATVFRVRNAGTHTHAFRVRTTGSGGDRQEWRSGPIAPGEDVVVDVELPIGTLEVDCPVEDDAGEHDALGMETTLVVRAGAPPLTPPTPPSPATTPAPSTPSAPADAGGTAAPADPAAPVDREVAIDIAAFAFDPSDVTVPVGTTVTWANQDPTSHTATGPDFDTGTLGGGDSGVATFDQPGEFAYVCSIHPSMTGRIVVE